MARSAEKAMTALARWRAVYVDKHKLPDKRPSNPEVIYDERKAERFRRQVIMEISRLVAQIQNAGLGEYKIRDINDEINNLLREKTRWEDRIIALGGPDYRKIAPKMIDTDGHEVPAVRGYLYFGAAKSLPGVKELFEQEPTPSTRRTRGELMRGIDADYYGYLDDDDGMLTPVEAKAEQKAREKLVNEWHEKHPDAPKVSVTANKMEVASEPSASHNGSGDSAVEIDKLTFIAHVPLPTREQVEAAIVDRRKAELLSLYGLDDDDDDDDDGDKDSGDQEKSMAVN